MTSDEIKSAVDELCLVARKVMSDAVVGSTLDVAHGIRLYFSVESSEYRILRRANEFAGTLLGSWQTIVAFGPYTNNTETTVWIAQQLLRPRVEVEVEVLMEAQVQLPIMKWLPQPNGTQTAHCRVTNASWSVNPGKKQFQHYVGGLLQRTSTYTGTLEQFQDQLELERYNKIVRPLRIVYGKP